jgi:sugar lactone lactonase YvrE
VKKSWLLLLLFLCSWGGAAMTLGQSNYEPYSFTTLAGVAPGSTDGVGSTARFFFPNSVALDSTGNLYVADAGNYTIRKVTPSGVVSTLAGVAGSSGSADGTGSNARFFQPAGVAVDNAGNIYVADSGNYTIRKVTACGVVSTVAGLAGTLGSADGSGSDARFSFPAGLAIDSANNVYVVDSGNNTIRKITPSGVVTTLAGLAGSSGSADGIGNTARFFQPYGVAVDGAANVYVTDTNNYTIRKITPSGLVSTLAGVAGSSGSADGAGSAARFSFPQGVAVDGAANVYVTDTNNFTIRKISPSGGVTTLAGLAGSRGGKDGTGNGARFDFPNGVAVDGASNLFVADTVNSTIRKITPAGVVSTLAGAAGSLGSADGTGSNASFTSPQGVAVDSAGNVYVADTGNYIIRKITPSGVVTTLAGLARNPGTADGTGNAARFFQPAGVTVDSAFNVYVADTGNFTIRKITPSGVVTTFAGLAGNTGSTDGTGNAARFNNPYGVAADSAGNIYVADTNNSTIRKITPSAVVTTLAGLAGSTGSADGAGNAARFFQPAGVAVDGAGNLYVADTINNTIRKITPSGVVSTLAGLAGSSGSTDGAGNAARFNNPYGVALDGAGNLYVVDTLNNTIRKITPSGVVTTLAGVAGIRGSADGTGRIARFTSPNGLAADGAGNGHVYVADSINSTIRIGVKAPPVITSPLAAIGVIAQKFVYQFEALQADSLAASDLPAGLTFDPARSAIVGISTSTGTFPVTLTASNSVGTTSAVLTLVIQATPPSGPVIISGTSVTGRTGQPFQFQVVTVNGSPAAQLTADCPCGLSADPVSGLISGTPIADGSTKTTLTVTDGSFVTTGTLQLTFTSDTARPVIISADRATLVAGQAFSYTIVAPTSDSESPPTFSELGKLPSGLSFDAKTGTISGIYTGNPDRIGPPDPKEFTGGVLGTIQLFSTNFHGTSTFQLLFLSKPSGAVNISTRTTVGTQDNVLIGGFIITGDAPEAIIIRAIGPSLKIPGALQDPFLELHSAFGEMVTNDDWRSTQEALIIDSKVPPSDDRESAIVAALDPGNYTAVVRGKGGTTGIAVVEVYDLGTAPLNRGSKAKLAQISTRGLVTTGDDVLIGGFIVDVMPTKVLVRAIGPELNGIVPGALQDTTLELRDGSGSLIVANDDWRTLQEQQIIDTTVPPKDDRESAIVATLNPGNYTAIVRGKNNTTGVALVEVYALQ